MFASPRPPRLSERRLAPVLRSSLLRRMEWRAGHNWSSGIMGLKKFLIYKSQMFYASIPTIPSFHDSSLGLTKAFIQESNEVG